MLTQMCLRTSKNSKQVNMLLYGHRNRKFFLGTGKAGGGGGGGGGGGSELLVRAIRPGKISEAVDHRQKNNYVKAVGTSPARSNLCTPLIAVSTDVWSRV